MSDKKEKDSKKEKGVSLEGLSLDEALKALLDTPPEPDQANKKVKKKPKNR